MTFCIAIFDSLNFCKCRNVVFSYKKFAALTQPLLVLALLQLNKTLRFNISLTVF